MKHHNGLIWRLYLLVLVLALLALIALFGWGRDLYTALWMGAVFVFILALGVSIFKNGGKS